MQQLLKEVYTMIQQGEYDDIKVSSDYTNVKVSNVKDYIILTKKVSDSHYSIIDSDEQFIGKVPSSELMMLINSRGLKC